MICGIDRPTGLTTVAPIGARGPSAVSPAMKPLIRGQSVPRPQVALLRLPEGPTKGLANAPSAYALLKPERVFGFIRAL
jgi:hypothetical protein